MPRKKQYNENEVLDRAMEVFWENGFEPTGVRDLERELGINQFSIYSSFKSKRDLFILSVRKYREHAEKNLFGGLINDDSTILELRKLLKVRIEEAGAGNRLGCFVVNTTGSLIARDDQIAEELKLYYDFIRNMLIKLLNNSVRKGLVDESTVIENTASYLLGVIQGLSVGVRIIPEDQLHAFIDTAFESILCNKY
ncbi:MAG: TetR/AcrR family transcriptional regulator [Bacteroidales bacterium]